MYKINSYYFYLLLIPIVYLFFYKYKKQFIKFPSFLVFKGRNLNNRGLHLLGPITIFIAFLFILIALSRPQKVEEKNLIKKDGIDIGIILDVSGSMDRRDISRKRLDIAKDVILDFLDKRDKDRIALIAFASHAFTRVPLTFDYNLIKQSVEMISTNDVSGSSTAIGEGIAVAVNRVKDSKSKTKILILITDGDNTGGEISPEIASNLAKDLKIKIYTIGVGRYYRGFNGQLLKNIANKTGGKFYFANSEEKFYEIFAEIDRLEKSKITDRDIYSYKEYYRGFLIFGIILLLFGLLLEKYIFLKLP